MTREEVLAICRKAKDVGSVKHEDYADFIIVMERSKQVNKEWVMTEHPYMAVDGKLAMANDDHRKQGKQLHFATPTVLVDDEKQLTLLVLVTSDAYGTRHGIATSRKVSGSAAEKSNPWEVAETSAIGRALTAMGYGLLPGAGLASAEDVARSGASAKGTPRVKQQHAVGDNNKGMQWHHRFALIQWGKAHPYYGSSQHFLNALHAVDKEGVVNLGMSDAEIQVVMSQYANQRADEKATKQAG